MERTIAKPALPVLLVVFLASRLGWLYWNHASPQVSDFAGYQHLACLLSHGHPFALGAFPANINALIQPWGWPLILAPLYALVGCQVVAAQLLNVLAGAGTLWLLYRFTREGFGEGAAVIAGALFVLWPTQLLYSSVLAAEHVGLCFACAGFVCLMVRRDVAAGLCFGVALFARSALAAAPLAAGLVLLLSPGAVRRSLRLGAGAVLVAAIYLGVTHVVYHQTPLPRSGLYLMVGSNPDSGGAWNWPDVSQYIQRPTLEAAEAWARGVVWARVSGDPVGYATLLLRKAVASWASDDYAAMYALQGSSPDMLARWLRCVALFHVLVLVLGGLGLAWALLHRQPLALLMVAFLALGTAVDATFELQARYHYVLEPALFVLAGGMVQSLAALRAHQWHFDRDVVPDAGVADAPPPGAVRAAVVVRQRARLAGALRAITDRLAPRR